MPELPDIVVYLEALEKRILDRTLARVQITSPFLLRTAAPPISSVEGKKIVELRRVGKRICFGVENDLWLILHLMIAGRLHWKDETARTNGAVARPSGRASNIVKTRTPLLTRGLQPHLPKAQLAAFQFDNGTLSLTEAGTQRRAALHLVEGEAGLKALDPGGRELFQKADRERGYKTAHRSQRVKPSSGGYRADVLGEFIDLQTFTSALQAENHTLKRALTDPRLFSGIGNAYSDEILWQAQLSPVKLTRKLSDEELQRLYRGTRDTLMKWVERLRAENGDRFPEKVTAFREGMAVHGRYREPCPRCGAKVQRIRYATNETNYCPKCQTGGKLLADRALSRILREDWPKTAEELE